MKKSLFLISSLLFVTLAINAQTELLGKELRLTSGFWGYSYYVGNDKVTPKEFAEVVKQKENAYNLFKSGKNLNTIGTVVGSVGAFCVGYDLGTRISGGSGSSGLLISGGIVAAGGIALGLIGEAKMKKAVKLFNDKDMAYYLEIKASPLDVGLCLKF